jgi:hypothetical protein
MKAGADIVQGEIPPFQSLTRMREAHTELIKNHREIGSSPQFIDDAIKFVLRARETGHYH